MSNQATATADDSAAVEDQATDTNTQEDQLDHLSEGDTTEQQTSDQDQSDSTDDADSSATDADDSDTNLEPATFDEIMAEYEAFTLPEGMSDSDADVTLRGLAPVLYEIAASQEEAQLLLDHALTADANAQQLRSEAWDTQLADWEKELKADREVGGDHFEKSKGLVSTALDKIGGQEVRSIFEESGLINNPVMFKFLHKLGTYTKEDVPGGNLGNNQTRELDRVELMYPTNSED